jgi:hypothetical protein
MFHKVLVICRRGRRSGRDSTTRGFSRGSQRLVTRQEWAKRHLEDHHKHTVALRPALIVLVKSIDQIAEHHWEPPTFLAKTLE